MVIGFWFCFFSELLVALIVLNLSVCRGNCTVDKFDGRVFAIHFRSVPLWPHVDHSVSTLSKFSLCGSGRILSISPAALYENLNRGCSGNVSGIGFWHVSLIQGTYVRKRFAPAAIEYFMYNLA